MKKNIQGYKIDTELGLYNYAVVVQEIVNGYIDEETGIYQPHFGLINLMRYFYNYCVKESIFSDKYSEIIDSDELEEIAKDSDFIEAFNEIINDKNNIICFDFINAYNDAMKIVDVKKTSFGSAVNIVSSMIDEIIDKITPLITKENIEAITKVAKGMYDGNLDAEKLVDIYVNKLADKELEQ